MACSSGQYRNLTPPHHQNAAQQFYFSTFAFDWLLGGGMPEYHLTSCHSTTPPNQDQHKKKIESTHHFFIPSLVRYFIIARSTSKWQRDTACTINIITTSFLRPQARYHFRPLSQTLQRGPRNFFASIIDTDNFKCQIRPKTEIVKLNYKLNKCSRNNIVTPVRGGQRPIIPCAFIVHHSK